MQTPPSDDDLDRPLGIDRAPRGRRERDIPYGRLALLGFAALAVSLGAFVYVTGDPDGGQPLAVAPIGAGQPGAAPPAKVAAAPNGPQGSPDDTQSDTVRKFAVDGNEIEDRNGVKVIRPKGAAGASGALIIQVPESLAVRLAPAPDKRLSQKSEFGVLPKIGADGARPADVYSRRVVLAKSLPTGAPRVALLLGGMGLDRDVTRKAIERLPQEVTLAFAADGYELAGQASAARNEGHEIMLQTPMEATGTTSAERGRRTLMADAAPSRNIERLHWMMGRFPGYIGVVGYPGGAFATQAGAMRPVLHEIADRGLVYADDGTSAGSVAKAVAAEAKVPFVATDVVVDATPRADEIDAALARLEGLARTRGAAVGSATGQPLSIDRIEQWARRLEAHGIALVPMSAMAVRPAAAIRSGPER